MLALFVTVVVKLQHASESPGGFVKTDFWVPPGVSNLRVLGWGWRICIFEKFLGDADSAALNNRLGLLLIYYITVSNSIIVLIFPFHKENLIQVYRSGTGRNPQPCYNLANRCLVTILMGRN